MNARKPQSTHNTEPIIDMSFSKFSNAVTRIILQEGNPTALALMMTIVSEIDWRTNTLQISDPELANRACIGLTSVKKYKKWLMEKGFISYSSERISGTRHEATVYRLDGIVEQITLGSSSSGKTSAPAPTPAKIAIVEHENHADSVGHLVEGDGHLVEGDGHLVEGDGHLVEGDGHLVEGDGHLTKADSRQTSGVLSPDDRKYIHIDIQQTKQDKLPNTTDMRAPVSAGGDDFETRLKNDFESQEQEKHDLLASVGVNMPVRGELAEYDIGWIERALSESKKSDIRNVPGFVVTWMRDNASRHEKPPKLPVSMTYDPDDPRRFAGGKYADFIES